MVTISENLAVISRRDTLTQQILDSVDSQNIVETKLATNQRIIARVTDGIYREPWAAFRELIVNAYDADASHVVVETSVPEFDQIVVRDDGIGMSPRTLAYVLQNIGGSSKRTADGVDLNTTQQEANDKSPGGRLLIGKIGIGLFAVAQLTHHFQIITKAAGDDFRTSATVHLQTHNETGIHPIKEEYVAGVVKIKSNRVPISEISTHGTAVVLYSLLPEVCRSLQSVRRWTAADLETGDGESVQDTPMYHIGYTDVDPILPWNATDTPEEKFEKLFEAAGHVTGRGTKSANLQHFDEYFKLVWKLSLSLPLEYLKSHPFDLDGSNDLIYLKVPKGPGQAKRIELSENESLRKNLKLRSGIVATHSKFSVTLDGIALRRPIRLPIELAKPSRIAAPTIMVAKQDNPFPTADFDRAGGSLSFEGYLYWNSKIVPKDTVGVLIRVREASGTLFDPTFLNYQVSEQTRLRQITAEIFVHEGLDSAVNIDRESFNYSHPHFLYIQRWLHKSLRLLVNRLKAFAAEDLAIEKQKRHHEAKEALLARAEEVWRRRYGEESDPPISDLTQGTLPEEVGGVEIDFSAEDLTEERDEKLALSVGLEAYGVLSNLPLQDRLQLIKDILWILNSDA